MNRIRGKQLRVVGAAGALFLLAAWQGLSPIKTVPRSSSAVQASVAYFKTDLLPPPPRESFAEVEQRPLFSVSRRPPPIVPPVPVIQTQPLEPYTVVGIIAAFNGGVALVRDPNNIILHVHRGQVLQGWTLEAIMKNKLVFSAGDQHQELSFKSTKSQQGKNDARTNMSLIPQGQTPLPGNSGALR